MSRLSTMVLMGIKLPLEAVMRQIASGIDILVHLGRLRDKSRKVLEIMEDMKKEKSGFNRYFPFRRREVRMEKSRGSG